MIKFGTDGWRAVLGKEFTLENVRRVAWAIAQYANQKKYVKGILVGFDRRTLSPESADAVIGILTQNGISVWRIPHPFPTPAVSFGVQYLGADLAVIITSSHNPPDWNGIKIKEKTGAPAPLATTRAVESWIEKAPTVLVPSVPHPNMGEIRNVDLVQPYMKFLGSQVDWDVLRSGAPSIVIDYMHGSGSNFLGKLLQEKGIPCTEIRTEHDTQFGGVAPEPLEKNLGPLIEELKKLPADKPAIGFALDGDGDRIGVIDPKMGFVSAHYLFAVLLHHLVEHKKRRGNVTKTFNISFLIDEMTKAYGLPLKVVPIGFKYIAEELIKADALMGGEESGGIGVKQRVPERDGALNALLLLESVAYEKISIGEYVQRLFEKFGSRFYARKDIHLEREKINKLLEKFRNVESLSLGGVTFSRKDEMDGMKWIGEEGWVLFRPSGTEPLLRIYAELRKKEKLNGVLADAATYALSG